MSADVDRQKTHPLAQRDTFRNVESYVLHLFHQRAYEEAERYVADRRLLDWGCNDGYGIELLLPAARTACGLDVAPAAIDAARARLQGRARIELFDGRRSSFDEESFDAITAFQLIEHVEDHAAFFRELLRVLAPGGIALFTTPNGSLRLNPGYPPWNPYHVREFRPEELRALLSPWFAEVRIFGMAGAAEITAVERGRVERNKAAQRGVSLPPAATPSPHGGGDSVRSPARLALRMLRALGARLRPGRPPVQDRPDLQRFSTRDLWYQDDAPEAAFDLLAVCKHRP